MLNRLQLAFWRPLVRLAGFIMSRASQGLLTHAVLLHICRVAITKDARNHPTLCNPSCDYLRLDSKHNKWYCTACATWLRTASPRDNVIKTLVLQERCFPCMKLLTPKTWNVPTIN